MKMEDKIIIASPAKAEEPDALAMTIHELKMAKDHLGDVTIMNGESIRRNYQHKYHALRLVSLAVDMLEEMED